MRACAIRSWNLAGAVVLASLSQPAAAEAEFPIVFESAQQARKIGFVLTGYGPGGDAARHFKKRCYDYGSATYHISVSDKVLQRFRQQGFSLRSLCFGLVSLVRFDPESGQRLPTFIITDMRAAAEELAQDYNQEAMAAGEETTLGRDITSPEIPLTLPPCFASGTPLIDCQWRFHPYTGRQLPRSLAARIAVIGRQIDEHVRARLAAGELRQSSDPPPGQPIENVGEAFPPSDNLPIPHDFKNLADPMQYDVSPDFPRGYGYALNAEGSGGPPSVSAYVVKDALDDGKPASQISIESILALIGD